MLAKCWPSSQCRESSLEVAVTITYHHEPGRLFHALFVLLHYSFSFLFFLVISQPLDPAPVFDTGENSHAHNV